MSRIDAHVSEGDLQACLDAEVDPAAVLGYMRHLRRCVECRRTMILVLHNTDQVARLLDSNARTNRQ
jgi:anti-sigma factor RsiW